MKEFLARIRGNFDFVFFGIRTDHTHNNTHQTYATWIGVKGPRQHTIHPTWWTGLRARSYKQKPTTMSIEVHVSWDDFCGYGTNRGTNFLSIWNELWNEFFEGLERIVEKHF